MRYCKNEKTNKALATTFEMVGYSATIYTVAAGCSYLIAKAVLNGKRKKLPKISKEALDASKKEEYDRLLNDVRRKYSETVK